MLSSVSDWDPNTFERQKDFYIYGDDNGNWRSEVDEEDYLWAVKWLWSPKASRGGKKIYLRRVHQVLLGADFKCPETGARKRQRRQTTLWLHVEIMKRTGIAPPCERHVIVDHINGNSLDNRRSNLRWATHTMNNLNARRAV